MSSAVRCNPGRSLERVIWDSVDLRSPVPDGLCVFHRRRVGAAGSKSWTRSVWPCSWASSRWDRRAVDGRRYAVAAAGSPSNGEGARNAATGERGGLPEWVERGRRGRKRAPGATTRSLASPRRSRPPVPGRVRGRPRRKSRGKPTSAGRRRNCRSGALLIGRRAVARPGRGSARAGPHVPGVK